MDTSSGGSSDSDDWEEVDGGREENEVDYIRARQADPNPLPLAAVPNTKETARSDTASLDGSVKVTVPHPNARVIKKGREKTKSVENYIVREINKNKKEVYLDLHRVGLLCLLARGLKYNQILRDESILAAGLSILPSERSYPPKNLDLSYLEKFLSWYRRTVTIIKGSSTIQNLNPTFSTLLESLIDQMGRKAVSGHTFYIFIFVAILRALGVHVRLIWNFVPPPIKPQSKDLMKLVAEDNDDEPKPSTSQSQVKNYNRSKSNLKKSPNRKLKRAKTENSDDSSDSGKSAAAKFFIDSDSEDDEPKRKTRKQRISGKAEHNTSNLKKSASAVVKKPDRGKKRNLKTSDSEEFSDYKPMESDLDEPQTKNRKQQASTKNSKRNAKKSTPMQQLKRMKKQNPDFSDSEEFSDPSSDSDEPERKTRKQRVSRKAKTFPAAANSATVAAKTNEKQKTKRAGNTGRKLVPASDEDNDPAQTIEKRENFWVEIFLEEEEQWVSVDVLQGSILANASLAAKATSPICYVMAFTPTGHVKDVTTRYAPKWWTDLGKFRDHKWWMETIRPFQGRKTSRDRREDEFLNEHTKSLPLPTTVSAFKNHPVYVLRRHLLKFEAIYPPDVIPVGYVRKEPVYPREAVQTLCARETWLRKARVVRIGEKPYKMVKARPKYVKNTGMVARDEPLDLFGLWQTEAYQPPIAVNGKVPRNEFGNVDLYMPSMLPIGTVHLQLPGLIRVCRKLDIDCAPAVVGFEFHAGGCHPKFDGFVVGEEFKEMVVDAWSQEQDEIKKREEENRLKRIYERWRRLYKGLLIRQKLTNRYGYTFTSNAAVASPSKKSVK